MGGRAKLVLYTHMETSGKIHWVFQQQTAKVPLSIWGHFKKPEPYNMLI